MEVYNHHPKIYLLAGKSRHGKDTLATFLKEKYEKKGKKVIISPYAKYIKFYAKEMTGWDGSEETKPRELLQQLGTNIIRQQLNKAQMFIDRQIDDIEIYSYFYDVIIIQDVRLKKEITELKKVYPNAKAIHVFRPNFDNGLTIEQKNHITEKDLDNFTDYDYSVINTTLEELEHQADEIISLKQNS